MKIRLLIEVDVPDMVCGRDAEERAHFQSAVLFAKDTINDPEQRLILHSNYIGDEVGGVRVLQITDWQPIESLPKAGPVLAGRFLAGKTTPEDRDGLVAVDAWQKRFNGLGQFNHRYWYATHWMPVPLRPDL